VNDVVSRRFTEQFAKKAHSVTCVDFMSSVLAVNRKAHSGYGNVSFINADVTALEQPNHRFLHNAYILQIIFAVLKLSFFTNTFDV